MKRLILASAIAACASSAMAADAIYSAPAPAEPVVVATPDKFSFSGFYVGAHTGYGWANYKQKENGRTTFKSDLDGAILGGFIGYNYQMDNNVVLGLDGNIEHNWNEKKGKIGVNDYKQDYDLTYSVRGRVGYAMDRTLIYATAGWAGARGHAEVSGPTRNLKTKGFGGALTAGVGVDYAITDNIFARAEYRYTNFGSTTVDNTKLNLDQHAIRVGLGVKF